MVAGMVKLAADPQVSDLTLSLNYHCNSACRFCFIEPELGQRLTDTSLDYVEEVYAQNRRVRAFKRIIFSGAEATLRKDLPALVSAALERGGFEVARIQTNGRRLADPRLTRTLYDAGLTEYFVSIHAPTAELDAHMTRDPKSFDEMRRGLANIRAVGATLISNSCVTRDNYAVLPELARFLLGEGVRESQFWAFLEFGDIAQLDQHVRHTESTPPLVEAASILRAGGATVGLSWFPICMLGPHVDAVDNHRSFTLIHANFKNRMHENMRFECPHSDTCVEFGKACVGLHERYVAVFGDERDALKPFRGPC